MYLILIFVQLLNSFWSTSDLEVKKFVLQENSEINIIGKSSFGNFTCESKSLYDNQQQVELAYTVIENIFHFQHGTLIIPVNGFDCGVNKITSDMQTLLHEDQYPEIGISLLMYIRMIQGTPMLSDNEEQGKLVMMFEIAGKEKEEELTVDRVINDDGFSLSGNVKLKLSDYGLETPKPMFGLVEISDEVVIQFNLNFLKI